MSLSAYPFSQGRPRWATEHLNAMFLERGNISPLKDTARLDRNDESQGRCRTMPVVAV